MDMKPATDTLEKCKTKCDGVDTCNAIEYAKKDGDKPNCCITLQCPAGELEPNLDQAQEHPGQGYMYQAFIKGTD